MLPSHALCAGVLALASLALAPAAPAQSIADQSGLTDLIERLGDGNQPTGAGVVVAQIEAFSGGYVPDPGHAEFAGKTFNLRSGASSPSSHATTAGRHYFGLITGLSPGPVEIWCWEASHWMSNFLKGTGTIPPLNVWPVKIMSNSWISSSSSNNKLLRKLDYGISDQGLVVTGGVNNGTGVLSSTMTCHMFNGMAVGRSDGSHRSGVTGFGIDGPGRMKPEIVAPGTATSWATPLVAGAASLLVETARTDPVLSTLPEAERPDLLKGILMCGAEKRAGWSNGAPATGPERGLTLTPLDAVFGADEIDVNQSHWILTSGAQAPGSVHTGLSPTGHRGWAVVPIDEGQSRYWLIENLSTKPLLDATAVWNREVFGDFKGYLMPDLSLRLWALDGQENLVSLVGDGGLGVFAGGNVASESPVDNVELLHVEDLEPGTYVLELERVSDGSFVGWEVAVAWNLPCAAPEVYCTAKLNSQGCAPAIEVSGLPSATDPNRFEIGASGVINNKNGLLFYGYAPAALPFQGGWLCAAPPLRRTGVQGSGGNPPPDDCSGTYLFDMRAHIQGGVDAQLVPGAGVFAQWWYRDPASASTTGLTDAVSFTLCQ